MRLLPALSVCLLLGSLLEAESRGRATQMGHHGRVHYEPLCFSEDGKSALVLESANGRGVWLTRWDLTTGRFQHLPSPRRSGRGPFVVPSAPIVLSPDGKWAARAESGDGLRVWEVVKPSAARRMAVPEDERIDQIVISRDAKRVAAEHLRGVSIWDVATGKKLFSRRAAEGGVTSLRFSPDGRQIAVGEFDGTLVIRDAETGRLLRRLVGHKARVIALTYSPSGRYLLSTSTPTGTEAKPTALLWELASGKVVWRITPDGYFYGGATFSPDERRIVAILVKDDDRPNRSGWRVGELTFWEARSGRPVRGVVRLPGLGGFGAFGPPLFSPDGRRALTGGDHLILWDARSWEEERTLAGVRPEGFAVERVAISPDGKQGLSVDGDTLVLWDLDRGKEVRAFEPIPGKPLSTSRDPFTGRLDTSQLISALAVSWKERLAVTGDNQGVLRFWDLNNSKLLRRVQAYRGDRLLGTGRVLGIALSPDARRVYMVGTEQQGTNCLRVWERETGKRLHDTEEISSCLPPLPDGKYALLARSKGDVGMWRQELFLLDLSNRRGLKKQLRWEIPCPDLVPVLVALAGEGKRLLTFNGKLILWDASAKKVLQADFPPLSPNPGFSPWPTALTISLDGRRGVYGNEVGELVLWDLERGKVERTLFGKGVGTAIRSLSLSADGTWALTGGDGGVVRLWNLRRGKVVWTLRRTPRPASPGDK